MSSNSSNLFVGDVPVVDADDWSGVSSSRKRRQIQNRLNQRTYRKHLTHTNAPVCENC